MATESPRTYRCATCELDLPAAAFSGTSELAQRYRCKSCDTLRKGGGDTRIIADITTGGDALASFGSPLERACAEQLIATGSLQGAADLIGIEARVLRAHLYELRRKAAARGYAPGNDMTKTTPDGYHVKGVSTYYDANGEVRGQWVKTKADEQHRLAMLLDAMSHIADAWFQVADPAPRPAKTDDELLCVYPMGDPHVGMFAWAEETGGDDFDLKIAEENMVQAVDTLVAGAPPASRALIIDLGDFFHGDNSENRTARSGNSLDIDTRWAKVIRVGVRAARRCIDRALERHASVDMWCVGGNHDDHSAVMLATCLAQFYEREPRVKIHPTAGAFHYMRFGLNLIGSTHGHTVKLDKLGPIMATDRARDWGETEHRYWYTGHVHHDSLKEFPGVIVETFRTLAPRDAWHAASGYRSGQDMKVDVLHKEDGRITRNTVGIRAIKRKLGKSL